MNCTEPNCKRPGIATCENCHKDKCAGHGHFVGRFFFCNAMCQHVGLKTMGAAA